MGAGPRSYRRFKTPNDAVVSVVRPPTYRTTQQRPLRLTDVRVAKSRYPKNEWEVLPANYPLIDY